MLPSFFLICHSFTLYVNYKIKNNMPAISRILFHISNIYFYISKSYLNKIHPKYMLMLHVHYQQLLAPLS